MLDELKNLEFGTLVSTLVPSIIFPIFFYYVYVFQLFGIFHNLFLHDTTTGRWQLVKLEKPNASFATLCCIATILRTQLKCTGWKIWLRFILDVVRNTSCWNMDHTILCALCVGNLSRCPKLGILSSVLVGVVDYKWLLCLPNFHLLLNIFADTTEENCSFIQVSPWTVWICNILKFQY